MTGTGDSANLQTVAITTECKVRIKIYLVMGKSVLIKSDDVLSLKIHYAYPLMGWLLFYIKLIFIIVIWEIPILYR